MPHARPHFGQGVIPTLPYFSWKVQMKGEHELQYVLGYTPQIQLGSRDATWRLRMEDKIGSVEVGKYADLAILEKNVFDVAPRDIADVKAQATMMDGKFTHRDGL